ncbi:hypothetical protein ACPV5U_11220 [Vibrio mediterranei]
MNGSTFRKVTRWIHFLMAALIGTFIYSPWSSNSIFEGFVLWVVIPLLTISGICMWKQGSIMKKLRGHKKLTAL